MINTHRERECKERKRERERRERVMEGTVTK